MSLDDTRTVYAGGLISVTVERWGGYEREIVEHPGAVAIVPVDREGYVTLVRQLREATRRELVELPAGTLKPGESPLETARRELSEETGLRGGEWRQVAAFWTTPGFCRERMTLFFAEDLEPGEPDPDDDESSSSCTGGSPRSGSGSGRSRTPRRWRDCCSTSGTRLLATARGGTHDLLPEASVSRKP